MKLKVHVTNIYGFIQDQDLKKKQNQFADAAHALGFKEMGIFNFDVSTDTENELSKRLDGIISSLQFNDLVFVQLPTGNGEYYDNLLINKLRAYNTKICVLLHEQIKYEYILNTVDLILPTNDEVYHYLMDNHFTNVFYKKNIHYEFDSNSSGLLSSDFYIKKYLIDAVDQLSQPVLDEQDESIIHVGFGLHDKDGHYSVWVGTAMQSIIDHTDSKLCFHILHDETVSEENKRKLAQVAHQKGDVVEFYKIDHTEFECIKDCTQTFTIGCMFRCMLAELLPNLSKIIYLDADLFVNRDIKELWDVDIREYCLAGVVDEGVINFSIPDILNEYPNIYRNQYFNSGVLFMNLDKIREKGHLKELVVDFLVNNREATYPDQDALNVLFHNKILYLDSSWNRFVSLHREDNKDNLDNAVFHYAGKNSLILYSQSKIDMEYFKTICRTPWSNYEIDHQINGCVGRLTDRINQYEKMMYRLSVSGVKHIFYGEENFMVREIYKLIKLGKDDYRVLKQARNYDDDILPCKNLEALEEECGPIIIFVRYESDNNTAIQNLEELGFVNGEDFFVIARFTSFLNGGFV